MSTPPTVEGVWRPIETAPTDGTLFVAFRPPHQSEVVKYRPGYERSGVQVAARFVDAHDRSLMIRWDCFTHWMPLPDPPLPTPGGK